MVASWQRGRTIYSDSRGTIKNKTTNPFWSIKNYRSLDIPKWVLDITNKNNEINHILVGRQSNIRSYTKVRHLLLLPVDNSEVSRIPTSCHNYVPDRVPVGKTYFPACRATSFRSPLQSSKRHFIRTPIMTWHKQRNYLRDTGEEAYLCSNGPRRYQYYHMSPSARYNKGSQSGYRLFRTALLQQLPSLIPVHHPFLDLADGDMW